MPRDHSAVLRAMYLVIMVAALGYSLFRVLHPAHFSSLFLLQAALVALGVRLFLFVSGAVRHQVSKQFGLYGFEYYYAGVIFDWLGGPKTLTVGFMITGVLILLVQFFFGPNPWQERRSAQDPNSPA